MDEYLCPAAVPDRAVLTSCPEKECVRRLRMVMALERVGHRLPYAVSRGYAAQKTSPVIGHSTAYNSDQFRIYWEEGKKGLPCLDFRGVCP